VLERLAETNSEKVKIIKVDVTKEREWATQEKIRGVPTFQFYRGGKKITQFSGAPPEAVLQQKIDKYSSSKKPNNGQVASDEADSTAESGEKVQPVIQRMPKDWLPAGVTRK